jgi:orotidine-5'-phosphate decarboxylase
MASADLGSLVKTGSLREPAPTQLIVALDFPREDAAWNVVEQLEGLDLVFKVGLELFSAAGPQLVRELVHRKKRVFLDLKFYDIPNTVAKAALQAALMHVEMFTLHLSGGQAMIQAVSKALGEIESLRPRVLGVSVLTSFDDLRWAEVSRAVSGHSSTVQDSVGRLVDEFSSSGLDGVVCSAHELASIRQNHPGLYTVVPGIRLERVEGDDQARTMTPEEAARAGASAIVMGRPLTQSPDPRAATEQVLEVLSRALVRQAGS